MMIAPASRRFFVSVASYGGTKFVKRQRAAGRRHVRRMNVVLQRNRNSVQRTSHMSLRAFGVARVRLVKRSGLTAMAALILPLYMAMRVRYSVTISRDVVRCSCIARCMSAMDVSTTVNVRGRGAAGCGCDVQTPKANAAAKNKMCFTRRYYTGVAAVVVSRR